MTEDTAKVTRLPAPTARELEIRRIVDAAPPLTAEQRTRIRQLIAPVLREASAARRKSA